MTLEGLVMEYLGKNSGEDRELIMNGSVRNADENRRIKDPGYRPGNAVIKVNMPEKQVRKFILAPEHVAYEDSDIMVVYKEAGIPSHPTPYSEVDSLAYGVKEYLVDKDDEPAVINRLDKPTRGLLLIAKHKEAERRLHRMFREKSIRKTYLALTEPFMPPEHNMIIRDRLEWNGKEKDALTYVRYAGIRDDRALFIVFPRTGRTHQIRKHFARYLRPVQGDRKYGGYSSGMLELICFAYSFRHPVSGRLVKVRYLPEGYRHLLKFSK